MKQNVAQEGGSKKNAAAQVQTMGEKVRIQMGARLREERERLGLSPASFAALGGASIHSAHEWERGASSPETEFLARVASRGVDVLYVLTAQRAAGSAEVLTPDQAAFVEHYQHADRERQAAARRELSACEKQKAREAAEIREKVCHW